MIKIENVEVMGWEAAIRGMRNSYNSWEKSDSGKCEDLHFGIKNCDCNDPAGCPVEDCERLIIGPNDHDLMMKLVNAGTDHRKFMRMITVYLDITAPFYFWKEFSTYKVGTVANSCSTMHKIADKEFTLEDFSTEHLYDSDRDMNEYINNNDGKERWACGHPMWLMNMMVGTLNYYREEYLKTKDKDIWWQMIQLLPSSYNQRRTVMLNYEVLANIYKSRCNHRLDEWRELCKFIESLPYSELITGGDTSCKS